MDLRIVNGGEALPAEGRRGPRKGRPSTPWKRPTTAPNLHFRRRRTGRSQAGATSQSGAQPGRPARAPDHAGDVMSTKKRMRGTAGAVLLLAGLSGGCATNPATGEREISLIGEGQEVQMGQESDPQIVASMGLYQDEAVQQYVNQLGQRLAAASERPDLPWTFRVIDDPTVNAFAVPGGFIYITRGLMAHMTSEAQLVGVLGHEIGHVTARHSVSQMSRQQLAQLGLGIGMILSPQLAQLGDLAGAGLQVLFLKYSRDNENEADELG